MNVHSNLKSILSEAEVAYSISTNDFYLASENSAAIDFDYKHTTKKPKFLTKDNLEFVQFSSNFYVLGRFDNFLTLPKSQSVKQILFEYDTFVTLSPLNINSRNSALLLAYYSGIINDFIGESAILTHTGILPSQSYNFFIVSNNNKSQRISLRNYSSFVDGVFESSNKIIIILCDLYNAKDISVKDLYIAYLYWEAKTLKDVSIVYMSFSNDVFTLYEIKFTTPERMNTAILNKHDSYKISDDIITYSDIKNVFRNTTLVKEPEIPFPQANEFERIVDLIHLLNNSELTLSDLAKEYSFDVRQAKYYTDASIYLGLIQTETINHKSVFLLTDLGKKIVSSKLKLKYLSLVETIVKHRVFNKVLEKYLDTSEIPNNYVVVNIMKDSNVYNIKSESTFTRRASTVQAWIRWIINLPNIYY